MITKPKPKTKKSKPKKVHYATSGRHHLDRRAALIGSAPEGQGKPDDLLNTTAVAEWLGCSTAWLEIGRSKNYGPEFVKQGTKIRYRRDAIWKWLDERTHACTSEYTNVKPAK